MSTKEESPQFQLDSLKWLVVVALILGGAYANSVYSEQVDLLYRVIALVIGGVVTAFIAVQTEKGHAFWNLLKDSQLELRKVVWPTRPETNQTTLLVVIVVIITAIILWGLDTFFGWIASNIIGS